MSKKDYGFLKGRNIELKDFQKGIYNELKRLNNLITKRFDLLVNEIKTIKGEIELLK